MLSYLMNNVGPYKAYPEEADFVLQRTVSLSGSGTYKVDFAEPENITNAQHVSSISFEPYPLREARYGAKWDVWDGSLNAANHRQTITIRYALHTYTLEWKMDSSAPVSSIPSEITNQYLGDEWRLNPDDTPLETSDRDEDGQTDVMIQPSSPVISNLAHQLADDKPDVYSKAKVIYDYMHENFKYSTSQQMNYVQQKYGGLPKHALATLRDGWGDCDDQSMLYMSLLRAVGLPARLEMGMLYDQQNNEWGGHAWAQIYIPQEDGTGGWYNVDIVNSEFLFRDCNRMTTWVDDGDGEHLSDYYHVCSSSTSVSFEESDTSISYTPHGEVRVGVGEPSDFQMPGFEWVLVPVALSIAFILKRKKR